MALITKVDCVQIPVPDLEEGLAFYRDRLGHALVWRLSTGAGLRLPCSDVSSMVALAVDEASGRVVGFATALTDGVLSAHITLVEVLPGYRRRGIGSALVRRLLDRFGDLYAVAVVCDAELLPFCQVCGFTPVAAAVRRRHTPLFPLCPCGSSS